MKKDQIMSLIDAFDNAKYIEEVESGDTTECWSARDLQELLGYLRWENFKKVIEKAQIACENAGQKVGDHFLETELTISIGSKSRRQIEDFLLTRYACYLIAQNGDPRKEEIAFAMTYFAIQTRKQEILEQRIGEFERLLAREKLTESEKMLSKIVYERGIDGPGFGRLRSKGDRALFGHSTQAMKKKLDAPIKRPLADFLPTITIKAKDFATEMTNFKLEEQSQIIGEIPITREHVKNNQIVRNALLDAGIKPEDLPPAEDIKKVKRRITSDGKKLIKETKKLKKSDE